MSFEELIRSTISEQLSEIRTIVREEVKAVMREVGDNESRSPLLSIKEACAFLKCSPPTLLAMRRAGLVKEHYVGTQPKFRESELLIAKDQAPKYSRKNNAS